ncbi:hypothetical protein GCM10010967_47570 [Dyadobacter beijingensis]|uniref:DUF4199 domain-containing protein n=1 Tax=Dyadobacter beijingensis TaxID=365489 RepID=A0ABQ2IEI3_9BACT|nr:hypothetical protein [Dyadobacter beijingensis]GGN06722.1 hypothetical protein GCM10010967_47570 [Dyadobacter beijingensis]
MAELYSQGTSNNRGKFLVEYSIKQKATWAFALAYLLTVLYVIVVVAENRVDVAKTVMICISGVALGWVSGILISPSSERESARFTKAGQVVSAFISGWLFTKIDRPVEAYITKVVQSISDEQAELSISSLSLVQLLGATVSFSITLITVYINRAEEYSKKSQPTSNPHQQAKLNPGSIP